MYTTHTHILSSFDRSESKPLIQTFFSVFWFWFATKMTRCSNFALTVCFTPQLDLCKAFFHHQSVLAIFHPKMRLVCELEFQDEPLESICASIGKIAGRASHS